MNIDLDYWLQHCHMENDVFRYGAFWGSIMIICGIITIYYKIMEKCEAEAMEKVESEVKPEVIDKKGNNSETTKSDEPKKYTSEEKAEVKQEILQSMAGQSTSKAKEWRYI